MNTIKKLSLVPFAFLLVSCASSYKPIIPDRLSFPSSTEAAGVKMSYHYNVLDFTRNKRYAKKEPIKGVRVLAVELTNETGKPLIFNEDIQLYAGDTRAELLPPDVIKKELRQQGGWYMFWSLLWVVITKCDDGDCSVVPLPIGALIGVINLGKANGANNGLLMQLSRHDLRNKIIPPGETVYGLVGIRTLRQDPLSVKLKN
jgi:hypothetical protein